MKPNFALTLAEDRVAVLHRTSTGWMEIGSVDPAAPDMADALGYLRSTALELATGELRTKLILPESQILYQEVEAPGPDAASRRKQIRKALEGRTPYSVDDLVFDWSGKGTMVQVAVIARETLAEAEAFAVQFRMNPVAFAASPESDGFKGEPWFGLTEAAADLLPKGTRVERDKEPVGGVRRAAKTEPQVEESPIAQIEAPAQDLTPPASEPVSEPSLPEIDVQDQVVIADTGLTQNAGGDADQQQEFVAATPSKTTTTQDTVAPEPDATPPLAGVTETRIADFAEHPAQETVQGTAEATLSHEPASWPIGEAAAGTARADPSDLQKPSTSLKITSATAAPVAGFSSRRTPATEPALSARPQASVVIPMAGRSPVADPRREPVRMTGTGAAKPAASSFRKPGKPLSGLVTAPGIPGMGSRRAKVTIPAAPRAAAVSDRAKSASDSKSLGSFTGRSAAKQAGKPRFLGLLLVAVLLLALAGVAAWSSYYLTSNEDAKTTAATETADLGTSSPDVTPGVEDEILADGQDPADFAISDPGVAADAAADSTAGTDQVALATPPLDAPVPEEAPEPVALPEPEPAPAPASIADGAAPPASPTQAQDEIFLATMDAPPGLQDAASLPGPAAKPDAQPAVQAPPPPFGTVYEFGTDGLIKPTAEGIMTPEGVFLIAGRPGKTPPDRPAYPEPVLTAAEPLISTPVVAPAAQADPALAGFRPRSRPEGLVPALPSSADQGVLTDASETRVVSLRPRTRPAKVLAAGEAARQATEAATLSAAAALAAAPEPDPVEVASNIAIAPLNISPLAISVSRKPAARPATLSKSIETALTAAIREPTTRARRTSPDDEPTNLSAPEADNEPERQVASAAPRIPTRASVAKQATYKNAINLRNTNLIGVYGTPASRYALVRQSNGRIKKVAIGDRVDGGVVAAITATEVRYQKGGRLISLAMPKG